jgi:chromosome partitioning protein
MAKIISLANQKGGVGKTTSCVNVAASLGLLGHRVLIIDLDPQGNTTSGVGIAKRGLSGSTKELLNGEMSAKDIVRETPYENLWAIPANTTLTSAEFELFDFDDSEYRMKKALAETISRFKKIYGIIHRTV